MLGMFYATLIMIEQLNTFIAEVAKQMYATYYR